MVVVVIDLYVVQDGFDGHLARGLARTEWFASDSPMCLVSHLPLVGTHRSHAHVVKRQRPQRSRQ